MEAEIGNHLSIYTGSGQKTNRVPVFIEFWVTTVALQRCDHDYRGYSEAWSLVRSVGGL